MTGYHCYGAYQVISVLFGQLRGFSDTLLFHGIKHGTVEYCPQRSVFSTELNLLQTGKPLPLSSKLIILRPFIDGEGLLRVGGRI